MISVSSHSFFSLEVVLFPLAAKHYHVPPLIMSAQETRVAIVVGATVSKRNRLHVACYQSLTRDIAVWHGY